MTAQALRMTTAGAAIPFRPALDQRRWRSDAERQRQERELVVRYLRAGDVGAREELVHRFLPLARQLARRYHNGREPIDDLVQVASVGLLKAIDRFDPDRNTTFSSFAVPTIVGELKHHFRDHGWAVHVPRGLQERSALVDRATDGLWRKLGRRPTAAEVAKRANTTVEEVLDAGHAAAACRTVSLEASADGPDPYTDALRVEEPGYRRAEERATVARLMSVLDDRDREILRLRFVEELVQREIAERLGLSEMHISRLIRQALACLREAAEAEATHPSCSRG